MNCCAFIASFRANSHCLGSSLLYWLNLSIKSSLERAQIQHALVQSTIVCRQESRAPHSLHASETHIFLCTRTSAVGIELLASLHKNCLIFGGRLTAHSDDHELLSCPAPEVPSSSPIQDSLTFFVCIISMYTDLTEKPPFFSVLHA